MRKSIILLVGNVFALLPMLVGVPAFAADSYADDRAKIENLQARYMFAMDWRDADTYASCFTENGVLDYAGGVENGRKAIHDMIVRMRERGEKAAKENPGQRQGWMRHNITNIVLKIDGNKAIGRAYWTEFENRKDVNHAEIGAFGHYEDELVKINGEWFFTKRKIYNEQMEKRAASSKSPAW
jgi:SnoaL-like protein